MKKRSTPEQRVGRAANVTIFLGILFTFVHLLALSGLPAMAQRGYGLPGLVIAVGATLGGPLRRSASDDVVTFVTRFPPTLGLGYGIRYGSYAACYLATGGFAALGAYFAIRFATTGEPAMLLRCVVTAWAAVSLCRAIPDMRTLRQNAAFPLPMSRYGAFFLRRWGKRRENTGERSKTVIR